LCAQAIEVAVAEGLHEMELQQELQRFTTQFTDRITQAMETLESAAPPGVRDEAMRKNLLYVSSAMEIAAGPVPEVNLLDMIVFVRLCRGVLERHWIPKVYGEQGAALAEVFNKSELELKAVADQALSPMQRTQLSSLVDAWLAENPGQVRVEGVRLADFSAAAGSAAADRAIQSKGLLSSVKTASHAANQALLLSERAMFLLHRMPFLWRLQARLGAREIVSDSITSFSEGPEAPLQRMLRKARAITLQVLLYVALFAGLFLLLWWIIGR
jgi:hypothetical protein